MLVKRYKEPAFADLLLFFMRHPCQLRAGGGVAIYTQGGALYGGKKKSGGTANPRYHNGALRRKYRARFKAMGASCGICRGRFGPIDYAAPSDAAHPLSFVIDEIRPVSLWRQFGYASPQAAADDWDNLQPAHYACNAAKGNKVSTKLTVGSVNGIKAENNNVLRNVSISDGDW